MSLSRDIKDLKRFQQIVKALFKVGLGHLVKQLRLKEHLTLHQRLQKDKFQDRRVEPYMVRNALSELGGAFVKFGQLLSLRPDLIPFDYVKELEKLQDKVKPIPFSEVKDTVETELKQPIDALFLSFDKKPIAAASIAQVHKATLKSGEVVAVKVMRPNIRETMRKDIEIMYFLAKILEKHGYTFHNYSPYHLVEEFAKWTSRELDFKIEARNAKVFRHNFKNSKTVYIPKVYDTLSTEKLLVLEYLDGLDLHDIKKVKRKRYNLEKLMVSGFEAILEQVFEHGFFHADPHPGNILILKDNRIAFIDFGIVGYFDEKLKKFSLTLMQGIIENDVDLVTKTLLDSGLSGADSMFKIELEELIAPLQDASITDVKISKVLEDVMNLAYKYDVRFPVDFILFGKTIFTMEGVALKYSPKFKLVKSAKPFIRRLIKKKLAPVDIAKRWIRGTHQLKDFIFELPDRTTKLIRGLQSADADIKDIDRDIRDLTVEMDKSSNRLSVSLIITGLIIASVITLSYDQLTILGISALSFIAFVLIGILLIYLIISVLREKRY